MKCKQKAAGDGLFGSFALERGADGEQGFEFAYGAAAGFFALALGTAEPAGARGMDDSAFRTWPALLRMRAGAFEEEEGGTEADFVTGAEFAFADRGTVDKRSVTAVQVHQEDAAIGLRAERTVAAGYGGIGQGDFASGVAAEDERPAFDGDRMSEQGTGDTDDVGGIICHGKPRIAHLSEWIGLVQGGLSLSIVPGERGNLYAFCFQRDARLASLAVGLR